LSANVLVKGDRKFVKYPYSNGENREQELEEVVKEKAAEIFGEYTFYFDKKQLKSEKMDIRTIPDGFLLDTSDPDNPIFYIIEVELKTHGLKHIASQILTFAITYRESKPTLNRIIKDTIRKDEELHKKISDRIEASKSYRFLDQLIDASMEENLPKVYVPIDGLEEDLKEVQNYIAVPMAYVPIQTYVEPESGEKIHAFTRMYEEEAREVGTYYEFLIGDVEIVDISRLEFDEERGISKHAQGYVFIRDISGKPTGIVFWWYRSRLDKHIKREIRNGITQADTGRPVDPSSYEVGMDVYIGETFWDRDANKRVEDPKYRIKGKLEEIYRIDGNKRTRIFPIETES